MTEVNMLKVRRTTRRNKTRRTYKRKDKTRRRKRWCQNSKKY